MVGGIQLKAWRDRMALTQGELAEKSGVGIATIVRIEQGKSARPSTRRKLAEVLGITPAELVQGPKSSD